MASIILSSANFYAEMSTDFFKQYLDYTEQFKQLPRSKDNDSDVERYLKAVNLQYGIKKNAVAAVVFQTLAIEAYINLFGMITFGAQLFSDKYERQSSTKKLKTICASFNKEYPEEHLSRIHDLFEKRHRIVHEKPKEFSIRIPPFESLNSEKCYDDIEKILERDSYIINNIADEMALYKQLQNNIMCIRDSNTELIREIQEMQMSANVEETIDTFGSIFGSTS